jgi:hypothetical protein
MPPADNPQVQGIDVTHLNVETSGIESPEQEGKNNIFSQTRESQF